MCDHGCHGVNDCAHDREQDTWIVSDRPASTETGPVHQPQMGRDGGESDAR